LNVKIYSFIFLLIQAQNNVSILSEVSTCLSDALDTIFNNGHSIIMPENNHMNFGIPNNTGALSPEALKLIMNKRKLASNAAINEDNEHDNAKRLCSINGHHQQA
jgi:hypothetical protein